jgi:hypothetical protein
VKWYFCNAVILILLCVFDPATADGRAAHQLDIPSGFDLPAAMQSLFDNYNAESKSSKYDVPQTTLFDLDHSGFERGDDIIVRPFWISSIEELRRRKVVLLAYAVPDVQNYEPLFEGDSPFSCHVCAPLIGAFIFSHEEGQWRVENSRTVVTQAGGWGKPPEDVRIVKIGPNRIAISIRDNFLAQGQTTTIDRLLIPWKGKVNEALARVVADDDKGMCGKEKPAQPCYANSRSLRFLSGSNPDYYDLVLTLSGTDIARNGASVKPVRGIEKLSLKEGIYKTVSSTGSKTSVERFMEEVGKTP